MASRWALNLMGDISQDVVALLQYLLPGFLAAWVYYGLTSFPKPSQFERVVQALIFTLLVRALVFALKSGLLGVGKHWAILPWTDDSELVASVACAFLLGVVFTYSANNDVFHALMRKLKITREMSYPSEWYSAFSNHVTYVVLHLEGSIRIYGWPIEWPSEPEQGHFLLTDACWLDADNNETPMAHGTRVLVRASDVRVVEFMDLN